MAVEISLRSSPSQLPSCISAKRKISDGNFIHSSLRLVPLPRLNGRRNDDNIDDNGNSNVGDHTAADFDFVATSTSTTTTATITATPTTATTTITTFDTFCVCYYY